VIARLRGKHLGNWLPGWGAHLLRRARAPRPSGLRHLLFAFCDHYEPGWGGADDARGDSRVRAWEERYPELAAQFRDGDGRPPRHSFFFPGEQYRPEWLERLGRLAAAGLGEVEVHLHHDNDTAASLREGLARTIAHFARHGHLAREAGRPRYAFIHGNWCLANARKDGRWCGVDAEIPLLHETGCYADFTFPSAPDECQPRIVNRIYWPDGDLGARRAYEHGTPARVGEMRRDRILMVQGPLALARRPGRLAPRIESAAVTAADPGSGARVRTWVEQGISVEGRPEWVFVKVHTHGAPEAQAESLLGAGGEALHRALQRYNDGRAWRLHYLTAREMYNVAAAAIDGREGDPNGFRDYLLPPPPVAGGAG
jgi:hypothetical protein